MGSPAILAFLATFLVLHSLTAADFLAPLLSPFLDDVCKEIECGKGKCKSSLDYNLPFICECESGWKQSLSDEDDNRDLFHFLPCVIPNCTVDVSCDKVAEPPMPVIREPPMNESFFDVCYWAYCGGGSCVKSNKYGYKCECHEGYDNLLNVTGFPCFKDCAIGMDCARFGIVSNESATSTSNMNDKSQSHAITILDGKFLWLVILMISLAMVPWK